MCKVQQNKVQHIVLWSRQANNVFATYFNAKILLTKYILKQIKITYFIRKKGLYTNKIDNIIAIDIVKHMEMTKIIFENVYNIFS